MQNEIICMATAWQRAQQGDFNHNLALALFGRQLQYLAMTSLGDVLLANSRRVAAPQAGVQEHVKPDTLSSAEWELTLEQPQLILDPGLEPAALLSLRNSTRLTITMRQPSPTFGAVTL